MGIFFHPVKMWNVFFFILLSNFFIYVKMWNDFFILLRSFFCLVNMWNNFFHLAKVILLPCQNVFSFRCDNFFILSKCEMGFFITLRWLFHLVEMWNKFFILLKWFFHLFMYTNLHVYKLMYTNLDVCRYTIFKMVLAGPQKIKLLMQNKFYMHKHLFWIIINIGNS